MVMKLENFDTAHILLSGANLAFEFVCVSLTILFILFCCIPVLHKRARAIIRPWAVYHVENGLGWVALLQQYRTPFLTKLMEQSSQSVSVSFYVRYYALNQGLYARLLTLMQHICRGLLYHY